MATAPAWIDGESIDTLIDESIDVAPGGSMVVVDGWVVRLMVDPLIAGRSPVRFSADGDGAMRISEVPEGSPWARIGLRDGDLLVKVDGKSPGAELDTLRQRYAECPLQVTLELQRDGQALSIRLVINSDRTWKSRDSESSSTANQADSSSLDGVEAVVGEDDRNTLPGVGLLADHVRCRDEAHCEVSVAVVHAYQATPDAFARQARVVPALRDGVTHGVKMYGIRPGSLPKLLGCKNGDMLVGIDGDASSLDEALARLSKLGRGDRLQLEFERKGKPRSLEIEIVAPFAKDE